MKIALLVMALVALVALGVLTVNSTSTAQPVTTQVPPSPPLFWTSLPQPPSGRTGVYTACIDGRRVILAEGGPNSSPALAVSPIDQCR